MIPLLILASAIVPVLARGAISLTRAWLPSNVSSCLTCALEAVHRRQPYSIRPPKFGTHSQSIRVKSYRLIRGLAGTAFALPHT